MDAVNQGDMTYDFEDEIRIILLGKTGNGKSATGNTLLGENKFKSQVSAESTTKKCSRYTAMRFEKNLQIIDTPGLFDTSVPNETVQEEIAKCIFMTSPGAHAFILVLSMSRFTEEEANAVNKFVSQFGTDIYEYFIVLFTRKDDLDFDGLTIEDHVKSIPENLKMIIEKCGNRYFAFNNRLSGQMQDNQVKDLLEIIDKNIKRNKGQCYTHKMYEKAEIILREEEATRRKQLQEEQDKKISELMDRIEKKYQAQIDAQNKAYEAAQKRLIELSELIVEQNKQFIDAIAAMHDRDIEERKRIDKENREERQRIDKENRDERQRIDKENREERERFAKENLEDRKRKEAEIRETTRKEVENSFRKKGFFRRAFNL